LDEQSAAVILWRMGSRHGDIKNRLATKKNNVLAIRRVEDA